MLFFMHVGKTGGTQVKRFIRNAVGAPKLQEPQVIQDRIVLLNHCTLGEAEKRFGEPTGLILTYRDPIERFVSGFYCRQRMGLPEHRARWDAAEAAAFLYFKTANDLAEALSSEDPTKYSAAHFSMHAIRHIRRGYQFHFGHPSSFVLDYGTRIRACVETKDLERSWHKIIQAIDGDTPKRARPTTTSATPDYPKTLSDLARSNLRSNWAVEFEFYNVFKTLDESLEENLSYW
ncbi:sulfotransferase family 2 domain-containing protein [Phaeobacter gallaeciensis]|uniref:sulfotransferase family 2 domain-containing protein n=1 Tax=Phaeobacter gallaeciensis TaxID=60890 RepID=UPI00238026F7|nr:sulfotransferase family 2 domain-containing protein [Phaeobacter gallaeciensis]MDE4276774.1 sulfotransferase family 2 domain-containing protein [Phaeobacter gallaeciensis]MDE4301997.1 sulfotransferase family 2 domain-containing protein [Phaeobacter gallaeciensis]MDE5187198.1 sulfotransferase family 2 domain-containing protein [Phaeobacter gallaeciensis]